MITSVHNPKIQLVRSLLGRPKERRAAKAFVAEGVRLVEEAWAADWPFRFVLFGETLSERGQELVKRVEAKGIEGGEGHRYATKLHLRNRNFAGHPGRPRLFSVLHSR